MSLSSIGRTAPVLAIITLMVLCCVPLTGGDQGYVGYTEIRNTHPDHPDPQTGTRAKTIPWLKINSHIDQDTIWMSGPDGPQATPYETRVTLNLTPDGDILVEGSSDRKDLDLLFISDRSGSMYGDTMDVVNNIDIIDQTLQAASVNPRYGFRTYEAIVDVDNQKTIGLTDDLDQFNNIIHRDVAYPTGQYDWCIGGGDERHYKPIMFAGEPMYQNHINWRDTDGDPNNGYDPGVIRIMLFLTDEANGKSSEFGYDKFTLDKAQYEPYMVEGEADPALVAKFTENSCLFSATPKVYVVTPGSCWIVTDSWSKALTDDNARYIVRVYRETLEVEMLYSTYTYQSLSVGAARYNLHLADPNNQESVDDAKGVYTAAVNCDGAVVYNVLNAITQAGGGFTENKTDPETTAQNIADRILDMIPSVTGAAVGVKLHVTIPTGIRVMSMSPMYNTPTGLQPPFEATDGPIELVWEMGDVDVNGFLPEVTYTIRATRASIANERDVPVFDPGGTYVSYDQWNFETNDFTTSITNKFYQSDGQAHMIQVLKVGKILVIPGSTFWDDEPINLTAEAFDQFTDTTPDLDGSMPFLDFNVTERLLDNFHWNLKMVEDEGQMMEISEPWDEKDKCVQVWNYRNDGEHPINVRANLDFVADPVNHPNYVNDDTDDVYGDSGILTPIVPDLDKLRIKKVEQGRIDDLRSSERTDTYTIIRGSKAEFRAVGFWTDDNNEEDVSFTLKGQTTWYTSVKTDETLGDGGAVSFTPLEVGRYKLEVHNDMGSDDPDDDRWDWCWIDVVSDMLNHLVLDGPDWVYAGSPDWDFESAVRKNIFTATAYDIKDGVSYDVSNSSNINLVWNSDVGIPILQSQKGSYPNLDIEYNQSCLEAITIIRNSGPDGPFSCYGYVNVTAYVKGDVSSSSGNLIMASKIVEIRPAPPSSIELSGERDDGVTITSGSEKEFELQAKDEYGNYIPNSGVNYTYTDEEGNEVTESFDWGWEGIDESDLDWDMGGDLTDTDEFSLDKEDDFTLTFNSDSEFNDAEGDINVEFEYTDPVTGETKKVIGVIKSLVVTNAFDIELNNLTVEPKRVLVDENGKARVAPVVEIFYTLPTTGEMSVEVTYEIVGLSGGKWTKTVSDLKGIPDETLAVIFDEKTFTNLKAGKEYTVKVKVEPKSFSGTFQIPQRELQEARSKWSGAVDNVWLIEMEGSRFCDKDSNNYAEVNIQAVTPPAATTPSFMPPAGLILIILIGVALLGMGGWGGKGHDSCRNPGKAAGKNRRFSRSRDAVSPVIATLLMVAIMVILVSIAYIWFVALIPSDKTDYPVVEARQDRMGNDEMKLTITDVDDLKSVDGFTVYVRNSNGENIEIWDLADIYDKSLHREEYNLTFVDADFDGTLSRGDYFKLRSGYGGIVKPGGSFILLYEQATVASMDINF